MVRVRFAPSPTGFLHIGNARMALFNYLFAKNSNGTFVLRIEDTDSERSKEEFVIAILEDLKWIGIEWNEGPDIGGEFGPYKQTERLSLYKESAQKLLNEGKAYKCYCTKEEREERNSKTGKHRSAGYDNFCRSISLETVEKHEKEGRKPVLRLKVPNKNIMVHDLIKGEVVFESQNIPDFVIMKSDGLPTFHFAVVIDDCLMKISHIIRGEDHLSNTPKHIMLFEALGYDIPQFAHMTMTLGLDKAKLSKRSGAAFVREYKEAGYLPEAFSNYMALLGWGTSDSQDIFSKEELIQKFSIDRCNKSNAVFDPEKLLWMNGLYMRKTTPERIFNLSIPYLKEAGILEDIVTEEEANYLIKAISFEQEKIKVLKDVPYHIGFFVQEPEYEEKAVNKYLTEEGKKVLKELLPLFEDSKEWTVTYLESIVREFCESKNYKAGIVFHPLRVSLSGKTTGPGLFELLEHLGKDKTIQRLRNWI